VQHQNHGKNEDTIDGNLPETCKKSPNNSKSLQRRTRGRMKLGIKVLVMIQTPFATPSDSNGKPIKT
jgi:hypothetical protein